ncbi:MAG TPA: hydroxyethylthiazole kinase [Desulfitobacteriaceae bacterium]|nr:hydroxyethylthiazole kinase [Desulfitobacteriaceae bacterium]
MFSKIIENVKAKAPLVHSITNYVTVNDCANVILASGGSPIMADDINEVCDITSICSSLVINIGTLNERTIKSMVAAGKKANELGHPVVFDPVGVGASQLRNETAMMLLKEVKFAVIRGNISEIKFLAGGSSNTQGVDASVTDALSAENIDSVITLAKAISKTTDTVIAISGASDIVTDSERSYIIKNGHPLMSRITGTGCMLTAVVGSYIGANPDNILDAAASAFVAMGLCGEKAYEKLCELNGGTGTYRVLLIDNISNLDIQTLKDGAKIESR